ncbi:type IV pilus biogenesis/stability protein PilW [Gallibacterium melopsittaci]|uniref:Type IV pilus biogenesis/stability protein PilW n=1 Tax=Gallibacterium melopsittaci TaxID=516063 RepID=A0ABV6HY44_9PAST
MARILTFSKFILLFFSLFYLFACSHSHQNSIPPTGNQAAAKTRVELGLAYLAQGNLALAKANLDKALQHTPNDYLPYLGLAYFYQHTAQNQQAEHYYQKALQLVPDNGDVLNNYATYLCNQRQFAQAFQLFDKALTSKAYYHFADTYENIAICAYLANDQQKFTAALAQLQKYAPEKAETLQQHIKN